MKTIRYEVQISTAGQWRTVATSNPTGEGMAYSMLGARQAESEGLLVRVVEIQEQQKLLWPDVGNCG